MSYIDMFEEHAKMMDDEEELCTIKYYPYKNLIDLSTKTINKVMREGALSHPLNDYMKRGLWEDIHHGIEHMQNSNLTFLSLEEQLEELEHAHSRTIIAIAKVIELISKKE